MDWFQLKPEIAAQGSPMAQPLRLGPSVLRGMLGFTLTSVAGFAPWALFGGFLHRTVGELGLYIACALVFMVLSGPALHRLIIGPRSLIKFYKLFVPAFALYAAAWITAYMLVRGHTGGVLGLFAGSAAMTVVLCAAFGCWREFPLVTAVLFTFNVAGYFGGGLVEAAISSNELFGSQRHILAMMSWGVCYGIGFGAGLGIAFYACQRRTRYMLANK
jgi:hypothetical protein